MPTRYWLVDPELAPGRRRLEAAGGVREPPRRPSTPTSSPRRTTRTRRSATPRSPRATPGRARRRRRRDAPGVKCLHAHVRLVPRRRRRPGGRAGWRDRACERPDERRDAASAAVDIGTNSVRLLVADVDGAGRRRACRPRSTGACGSHASARASTRDRRLHPRRSSARSRCCDEYGAAIDAISASTRVRATATSAARDAVEPRRPVRSAREGGARARARAARAATRRRGCRSSARPPGWRRARALPRRRHRRRLDRVRARHRRARGAALDRHRLRARHRAVPALRPARARGAVGRGVGRARPPRRRRARDPDCATRRRSSGSPAR